MNCFKKFSRVIGKDYVLHQIQGCQEEVHEWGRANKVTFDLGKEHLLILDPQHPHGEFFDILGVHFDTKLVMYNEVSRAASEASRRCHIVLKLRRFYSVTALFRLFKAHVRSYIERSNPAIFYSTLVETITMRPFTIPTPLTTDGWGNMCRGYGSGMMSTTFPYLRLT